MVEISHLLHGTGIVDVHRVSIHVVVVSLEFGDVVLQVLLLQKMGGFISRFLQHSFNSSITSKQALLILSQRLALVSPKTSTQPLLLGNPELPVSS